MITFATGAYPQLFLVTKDRPKMQFEEKETSRFLDYPIRSCLRSYPGGSIKWVEITDQSTAFQLSICPSRVVARNARNNLITSEHAAVGRHFSTLPPDRFSGRPVARARTTFVRAPPSCAAREKRSPAPPDSSETERGDR